MSEESKGSGGIDHQLLRDVRRDIDDAAEEIGQAIERAESGETTSAEALLGEAVTRLKLLSRRIGQRVEGA